MVAMTRVIDAFAGVGARVRIYVPPDANPHWIVYVHGGGGGVGSIDVSEPLTRYVAAQTCCTVACVDYRLALEDSHPTALADACVAWDTLVGLVPVGGRVAIAGDGIGALIAVHVERYARVTGRRRADLQVLVSPVLDVATADAAPASSPRFWTDLTNSSPALVVTTGLDPYADQGDSWAARLRAFGVRVRHERHDALGRDFLSRAAGVHAARAATDLLCADMLDLLDDPA